MHPLHVIYADVVGKKDPKVTHNFVFDFKYPSRASVMPLEFQTQVVWDERTKTLGVATAFHGVMFRPWEQTDAFLALLNRELRPYLHSHQAGGLRAFGINEHAGQYVPAYEFALICNSVFDERLLTQVFNELLYDRAALALWISRTVFGRVASTGQVPDALERMRLLSAEYARLIINLHEPIEDPPVPPGFYEGLYVRGLDRLQ